MQILRSIFIYITSERKLFKSRGELKCDNEDLYYTVESFIYLAAPRREMPLEDKSKFKLNLFTNSVQSFIGYFAHSRSG